MSVQRRVTPSGKVRYKARIKSHGHELTSRTFERRADCVAWEQDQMRRLRVGEWFDPRRGHASLTLVAEAWLLTRDGVKRRTRKTDTLVWKHYIMPSFGRRPVASLTTAEISEWLAQLVASGRSPATARRALSTLRSILNPRRCRRTHRQERRREGEAPSRWRYS